MLKFHHHPTAKAMEIALVRDEGARPFTLVPVPPAQSERHDRACEAAKAKGTMPAVDDGGGVVLDKKHIPLYRALC